MAIDKQGEPAQAVGNYSFMTWTPRNLFEVAEVLGQNGRTPLDLPRVKAGQFELRRKMLIAGLRYMCCVLQRNQDRKEVP